jgi:putative spermidine/putrescine transport system permease protein
MLHPFINNSNKRLLLSISTIGIIGCVLTAIVPIIYILTHFAGDAGLFIHELKAIFSDTVYRVVFRNTMIIILLVCLICIVLGLPVAFTLWNTSGTKAFVIICILCIPLLMNQIARNYAWIQILDSNGIINNILLYLGLRASPLQLIYNKFGVSLVLAQGFIPIFIFNVFVSLRSLPVSIKEASYTCGKNRIVTFFRIILPNIYQSIIGGLSLVAILSFGYFITPAMLGGRGGFTLPKLLYDEFNMYGGEMTSAVQSFLLLLIIIPFLYFSSRHILKTSA